MKIAGLIAALALSAAGASAAQAATYSYVGDWVLGAGDYWTNNPPVYSGVEAAAHLFGGNASEYVISTVDNNPSNINFKTWLDGWADPYTYAQNGAPASDNYSLDTGGGGYNSNPGSYSAYSALVHDHFDGTNTAFTNYAFRVSAAPEPAAWALMLVGIGGAGVVLRRTRRSSPPSAAAASS